ncbi:hypothetical protein K7A41_23475 [Sphingobacterium sp. InxBP1]|uniref:hypothetical protein n=1 Tax=Sphingobacterium sp. InxBP1 TaxID=2870328 RepID=UPI0022438AD7|nr:hypothetical protein [Sphingobacterium sp. InxBP1]MCW8314206.1 hypothetical protein [Sphingobacterium sp. InxBP1]
MKRFFPFILAASLAVTGCSKSDGPGDEKQIQEVKTGTNIRDKYVSLIPELKGYQHFAEGGTLNQKYKTIGALRGTDVLVVYIDASGKLFSTTKFKIDSKFIDKFGQLGFTVDNRTKPSDIASLMFWEKLNSSGPTGSPIPVLYSIVYPNNGKLINVGIDVSNLEYKFVSNMNLTFQTFYCYNGNRILSFERNTGAKLLESPINEAILSKSIASYYFEDNKFIVLYNENKDIVIKCFPININKGSQEPLWQNIIKDYGNLSDKDIDILDDKDNLTIKLISKKLEYRFKKSTGELLK